MFCILNEKMLQSSNIYNKSRDRSGTEDERGGGGKGGGQEEEECPRRWELSVRLYPRRRQLHGFIHTQ